MNFMMQNKQKNLLLAYEINYFLENIDDAPYKYESLAILNYYFENYNANYYSTDHPERIYPPKEENNVLQDSMEEEIAETESSLDKQKEEEWSHPCLPSNESNSLNLILYQIMKVCVAAPVHLQEK